jgi:hypothetical protein
MQFLKITDICLIREKFGVFKIFDTLQENQISVNYRYIERCPNINFPKNISDTKPIYEIYRIFSLSVKP